MSKHSIDWHNNCLRNMQRYAEEQAARVAREQRVLADLEQNIRTLAAQIERAALEGKDSFDPERYKV